MDSSKSCVVTLALYIRRHFSCDLKIHISCLLCLSDPYLPSVSLTESLVNDSLPCIMNNPASHWLMKLHLTSIIFRSEWTQLIVLESLPCVDSEISYFFLYIYYLGDCGMVSAWRSENSSRVLILSLHHAGSRDQMQNLKLGSEHLYSLSCLDGPTNPTFKSRMLNNVVVALLTCCYFGCVLCSLDQKCAQRCNHKPASLNSLALDRSAGFHYS